MKTTRRVVQGPGGSITVTAYMSNSSGVGDARGHSQLLQNGPGSAGPRGRTDSGDGRARTNDSGPGAKNSGSKPKRPSGPPMKQEGKTYDEIKAQCLRENRLFEDGDFVAVDSSVFPSKLPPRPFEWKRPGEMASNPQLFVGGASRLDIQQGNLGNCWLLAAISCLCQYPDLMERIIPKGQGFTSAEGYCGMFRFNFWRFGKWKEVIVDDLLPTLRGRLVFMHSPEQNEFWAALLEKAYAKVNGSYENLTGGSSSEAMVDFTGGVTEIFDLRGNPPPNLFDIMLKAVERESMMGCSIDQGGMTMEGELPNGLIVGHAYSVTGAKYVIVQTGGTKRKIPLVRARNPWGNDREWKGAWSDKSKEWTLLSEQERKNMGLHFDNDGEFWMSFEDFTKNFSQLEICNLGPDSTTNSSKKRFQMSAQDGGWKKKTNAGGCRNYRETFWTNPQYRVTVVDADEDDDDNTGSLVVSLMQKERRSKRTEGLTLLTIGYAIFPLKDPHCGPLDREFFKQKTVAKSPQFIDMREVTSRHKLPQGSYCIVPSTFEPNQQGDFLLRIFTEKPISSREVDEETKMEEPPKPATKTAADAQTEKLVRDKFKKISGDDREVDAYELQELLNSEFMKEFKFDGFSADTCRSLVAMKDADRSGKLGYEEFKKLWYDMRVWKTAFKNKDQDKGGTFDSYELREALHEIGISVSNSTFNSLIQRYSHRDGKMYFDDYIQCISRLTTMFDIFKQKSSGNKAAQFSADEFIATTMYS